jgi:hypothetical protein
LVAAMLVIVATIVASAWTRGTVPAQAGPIEPP